MKVQEGIIENKGIPVSSLETGIYVLLVSNKQVSKAFKFVKG